MKMHLQGTAGLQVIRSHGPGFITVNHDTFQESLVLTPETLVPGDWPRTLDTLGAQHFEAITRLNPEIVLLGTGTRLQHPSTDVLQPLLTTGIGYEVMDTGAACRTYNILLGEGRRVCALLLLTLAP